MPNNIRNNHNSDDTLNNDWPEFIRESHIVYDPHEGSERMTDSYPEIIGNEEDSVSIAEIL